MKTYSENSNSNEYKIDTVKYVEIKANLNLVHTGK